LNGNDIRQSEKKILEWVKYHRHLTECIYIYFLLWITFQVSHSKPLQPKAIEEAAARLFNFCITHDPSIVLHSDNSGEFVANVIKETLSL
ncbi:5550_t:CDS:1, partial [Ambispora leptoticha]